MTSKVEVANTALSMIGELPITSFTDDTKSARVVNQRYDTVRRSVLRDHFWNAAKSRVQLPALTNAPAFGWARQFQLPSDFLRMVRINGMYPFHARYVIEGEKILTDMAAPLNLIYVRDEQDPSVWDAMLVEAVAARLGAEIAMPITQSIDMRDRAWQLYRQKLQTARTTDAMDEPAGEFEADLWLRSRLSGTGPLPDYHWRDIDT